MRAGEAAALLLVTLTTAASHLLQAHAQAAELELVLRQCLGQGICHHLVGGQVGEADLVARDTLAHKVVCNVDVNRTERLHTGQGQGGKPAQTPSGTATTWGG